VAGVELTQVQCL